MEKIYCGSAKEVTFNDGGSVINVSLEMDKLEEYFKEFGFTSTTSGKRFLKLKIGRRRETGRFGETHTVEVDTWKPSGAGSAGNSAGGAGSAAPAANSAAAYLPRSAAPAQGTDFPDDIPGDSIPF